MYPDFPPQEPALGIRRFPGRTQARCIDLAARTGVDGIGVAVFADTAHDLVYATDSIAEQIDELQFTLGEGPSTDCFRLRTPEIHHRLASHHSAGRWPIFAIEVESLGVASIYAYPLAVGSSPLGVLALYGRRPSALSAEGDEICRRSTQSIAVSVLADLNPARMPSPYTGQRSFSRADVHVAVGILAGRHNISVEQALIRLQSTAYTEQRRITLVAQDVIDDHTDRSIG